MNRLSQIQAARQHAKEIKVMHQKFQVRKQPRLAATVSLERRAS